MDDNKLTAGRIWKILSRINFVFFGKGFDWRVLPKGDGFLIQIFTIMPCCETGEPAEQRGGKHYISSYATDTEVMFKAFKACKDFVIHELHEAFKVDDVRLFDPHMDLEALIDAARYMKRKDRTGSWTPQRPSIDV